MRAMILKKKKNFVKNNDYHLSMFIGLMIHIHRGGCGGGWVF